MKHSCPRQRKCTNNTINNRQSTSISQRQQIFKSPPPPPPPPPIKHLQQSQTNQDNNNNNNNIEEAGCDNGMETEPVPQLQGPHQKCDSKLDLDKHENVIKDGPSQQMPTTTLMNDVLNMIVPFCTKCNNPSNTGDTPSNNNNNNSNNKKKHHHEMCPKHPNFVGSKYHVKLNKVVCGMTANCLACHKEFRTGKVATALRHSCDRRFIRGRGRQRQSQPALTAPEPAQTAQQQQQQQQKDDDENHPPQNDAVKGIMRRQASGQTIAPPQEETNERPQQNYTPKESTRKQLGQTTASGLQLQASNVVLPALVDDGDDVVPFCRRCSESGGSTEVQPHHHVMCPKHADFPGSVMDGRLQDIRRGMRLGCGACQMEYQDGFVKRHYSCVPPHSEICQQQYERCRQANLSPPVVQQPHEAQQQRQVETQEPAAKNNNTRSRDDDPDKVPFCKLCNGKSSRHAVHHALCPKNSQFSKSGSKEILERIRQGMRLGCEVCRDEYEHGVVSKTNVKHNTKCQQLELQLQRQESLKRKTKRVTDDKTPKERKDKRPRLTERADQGKVTFDSRGRKIRLTEKMRASEATLSDVGGGSDDDEDDSENSPYLPESGRLRPLMGLLVAKDVGREEGRRTLSQTTGKPNKHVAKPKASKAKHAPKRSGFASSRLSPIEEENEPELMDEVAGGSQQCLPSDKPRWIPCPNPWGPEGHQEGDVVLFSPAIGCGHVETMLPSPRYVVEPFDSTTTYHKTHMTPQEGFHLLHLQRDPMATRPWGFSVYRHDFGSACLVKDVQPLSPAAAAVFAAASNANNSSGLRVDDMIIAINGQMVGGMTEIGLEVELEICGPNLYLLVSRYRFANQVVQRIAAEEKRVLNTIEATIQDERLLGWHVIGGVSTKAIDETQFTILQDEMEPRDEPAAHPSVVGEEAVVPTQQIEDKLPTQLACLDASSVAENNSIENSYSVTSPAGAKNIFAEPCNGGSSPSSQRRAGITDNSSSSDSESDESKRRSSDRGKHPWMGCVCGEEHPRALRAFWIQCDTCTAWYQVSTKCVGFTEEEAKARETYCCRACSDDGNNTEGDAEEEQVANEPLCSPKEQEVNQSTRQSMDPSQGIHSRLDPSQSIHSRLDPSQSIHSRLGSSPIICSRQDHSQNTRFRPDPSPIICSNPNPLAISRERQTLQYNDEQAPNTHAKHTVVPTQTNASEWYQRDALVTVKARSWPGKNSEGGVARVVDYRFDEDGSLLYHVKYIFGGSEKDVEAEFVGPYLFS